MTPKNNLFIITTLFLLLVSMAQLSNAALDDDIQAYYKADDNGTYPDATPNSLDGTNSGATFTSSGIINNAYDYDDAGSEYHELPNINFTGGEGTINVWIKPEATPTASRGGIVATLNSGGNSDFTEISLFHKSSADTFEIQMGDGVDQQVYDSGLSVTIGSWQMVTVRVNSTDVEVSVDASTNASTALTITPADSGEPYGVGRAGNFDGLYFDGVVDEIGLWNRSLTDSEVTELYNGGSPNETQQYPFSSGSVTLTTTDINDTTPNRNSDLQANTTITTTDGLVNLTAVWDINGVDKLTDTRTSLGNVTRITNFSCSTYNCTDGDNVTITWTANSTGGSSATNSDVEEIEDKGFVRITAFQKITNNNLTTFNITTPTTATTTNGTIIAEVDIGSVTISGVASNHLNTVTNNTETVTFQNTTNITLQGFFNVNATINVTSNTGTDINNYVATANTTTYSYDEEKTAPGTDAWFGLVNATWNISIRDANQGGVNYSKDNTTIELNAGSTTINFTVFLTNSLQLNFFNEETRELINNTNITIQFISDLEASNYTTTNGTLFQDAFTPAELEIKYNAEGYRERSYYYFLTNQSYNNLSLYLLNESQGNLIIITVVDESGEGVQGATLQLLRGYIIDENFEYEIVEMDKTDFGGEALVSAELNEPSYRIRIYDDVQNKTQWFFSNAFEITSTTLSITATILGDPLEGFNTWRDITYTKPTFNSTSNEWTATYNDVVGLINPNGEVCLKIYKTIGVDLQFLTETCSSATTATLTATDTDQTHGTIASLEANTNTENSIHSLSIVQTFTGVRDSIATELGSGGAFLALGIVYTIGAMLLFNPTTFIIGILAGFIAAFSIGLINVTWGATLSVLIIIGGIFAFKTNT